MCTSRYVLPRPGLRDISRADVHSLPLSTLLSPFLAIIRSSLSTGPITSTALTALHNFFLCGLFSPTSVSLQAALAELSSSLSSCKFEASDSSGDEVVLLKIMTVISDAMCGSIGRTLGDIEICEMLETVLTTSCQMRLSGKSSIAPMRAKNVNICSLEILRRSAEGTLHQLVRTVFARLHELDAKAEEQKVADVDDIEGGEMKMSVSASGPVVQSQEPTPPSEEDEPKPEDNEAQAPEESAPPPDHDQLEERQPETPSAPRLPCKRFLHRSWILQLKVWMVDGLPSILELLRVLINILDPNDQAHTDSTRLTALRTLNVALEATGARICAYASLSALILDHGCKFLFQLARSDHPVVLQSSLRAITTMFETMRPKLKLQHELFLAFTIDRLTPPPPPKNLALNQRALANPRGGSPSPSAPLLGPPEDDPEKAPSTPRLIVAPARGDTRELLLETLCQISRHPSFMVDLYANYDCDMNCENMFERLIEFCVKVVYSLWTRHSETQTVVGNLPGSGTWRTGLSATECTIPLSRSHSCVRWEYDCSG